MSGLIEVLKRYNIESLWISDSTNDSRLFETWQALLKIKEIKPLTVKQGDKMIFPDGTEISVLWPRKNLESKDLNDYSLVTLISYGNFDVLLTGDADRSNQPYTAGSSHVEVFKVPHHGAKTAINEDFVATISPEISVISVGAKNSYGHPRQEVIKSLENFVSKVYRTDKNGTVEIVSDGKSWYTKTNLKFKI